MYMGNAVDAGIEKFAVMRYQQHAAGIAREILFQPQDGFEIEVVGGLVQQQQVGAAHQGARQVEPHAPAAGKAAYRAHQLFVGKPQAIEQLRGAGWCSVALDGLEAVLGLKPFGVMHFALQHSLQLAQLAIAVEHELQRVALGIVDFLLYKSQGLALLESDLAAIGADFAADQTEQGGFAAAILAHQADALVGKNLQVGIV